MKRMFAVFMTAMLCILSSCALGEEFSEGIVLPAAEATFTSGKGVSFENKKAQSTYDKESGYILNLPKDAEVTFTVPEGIEGSYDIYLTVSKIMAQFTSQPFSYQIADGEVYSVPMDCQVSADSIAKYSADGDDCNTGSILDSGRFLIGENASLKAGDTIRVLATFGAKAGNLKGMVFPGVGDLMLVPVGTPVTVGYFITSPIWPESEPEKKCVTNLH